MTGQQILLNINGDRLAAATNAAIEIQQSLEEVTPLPGTDDGWEHYNVAGRSWSLSSDGFVTDDFTLAEDVVEGESQCSVDLEVEFPSATIHLYGDGTITEISQQAAVKSLAKFSAKISCDDLPTPSLQ